LNFFDKRQNIAHSENSLRDSVRIKRLDSVVFFADADEFHRLTDNLFNDKAAPPRASPSIFVKTRR
jgi:hypothetical protein